MYNITTTIIMDQNIIYRVYTWNVGSEETWTIIRQSHKLKKQWTEWRPLTM